MDTSTRLAGKIAVITGGGQGVGRGIALALAASGAAVFLVGRTQSKLDAVAGEIRDTGATAAALALDITSEGAADRIIQAACQEFGGVDILVNNANSAIPVPLVDSDEAYFRHAFEAGPLAGLSLMKAARPSMVERGGGVIINLASSTAVRWDATGYGVYAAIKEAQRSLTRTAAHEWAADGIRALTIAPHAHSPGLDWWMENNPEKAESFINSIPAKRIGDPVTDIGLPVAWLCSDEASYLTGATIPLDGGQARWS